MFLLQLCMLHRCCQLAKAVESNGAGNVPASGYSRGSYAYDYFTDVLESRVGAPHQDKYKPLNTHKIPSC